MFAALAAASPLTFDAHAPPPDAQPAVALAPAPALAPAQANAPADRAALLQALAQEPGSIALRAALATAHDQLGEPAAATAWLSDALRLCNAGSAEQLRLGQALALALHQQGLDQQALALTEQLLRDHANNADLICSTGYFLLNLGRREDSLARFRRVLELQPQHLNAQANLGAQLWRVGEFEAAVHHAAQALSQAPQSAVCQRVLGEALLQLNALAQARHHLELARADPAEAARAERLIAFAALLGGDFKRGWEFYRARWAGSANMRRPDFYQPDLEWDGEHLPGAHLLVYQEQGFGDVIQFVRYLPALRQRGFRVSLYVIDELAPLVQTVADIGIFSGSGMLHADRHVALLELPRILGVDLSNISPAPYLQVLPERRAAWGERVAPWAGQFKIGVAWSGRPGHDNDANRSFALAQFEPLLRQPGVQAFSLQKFLPDDTNDLQAALAHSLPLIDLTGHWQDWGDSAALVEQMDLVITIDSAVAHLAGALGKPTWVLLPPNPDWRWLLEREDSPWYASVRLFRRAFGESKEAQIQRVAAALAELGK